MTIMLENDVLNIQVTAAPLARALRSALPHVTKDKFLPVLTCILVTVEDGKIMLEATDRFTLVRASVPLTDEATRDARFMLAASDAKTLLSHLTKTSSTQLEFSGDFLTVGWQGELRFRAGYDSSSSFPKLRSLLPALEDCAETSGPATFTPEHLTKFGPVAFGPKFNRGVTFRSAKEAGVGLWRVDVDLEGVDYVGAIMSRRREN